MILRALLQVLEIPPDLALMNSVLSHQIKHLQLAHNLILHGLLDCALEVNIRILGSSQGGSKMMADEQLEIITPISKLPNYS